MNELMYADNLLLFVINKNELQQWIEKWRGVLSLHNPKINLTKTEVTTITNELEQIKIEIQPALILQ